MNIFTAVEKMGCLLKVRFVLALQTGFAFGVYFKVESVASKYINELIFTTCSTYESK